MEAMPMSTESRIAMGQSTEDLAPRRGARIEIVLGDITRAETDVIVSSVCPTLVDGGAVDRAVRRRAGTIVERQLARIAEERFATGLPIGGSVATCAGNLGAQWLVHAAGPVWDGTPRAIAELSATYVNALRLADELGAKSVAFPALSVGGCRFPIETGAAAAIAAVRAAECDVERLRFVLSNRLVFATWVAALVGER